MNGADAAVAGRRRGGGRAGAVGAAAVLVVLVLLIAVLATSEPSSSSLADSPLVGRPAPELAGQSLLDGSAFDLADQQGRFVLVNFFDASCVPCREEHPDLLRFATAHGRSGDAGVVTVVFTDRPARVRSFFAEEGGSWPVLHTPEAIAAWGVAGVPESYLVAPDGTVVAKIVGGVRFDQLEALLAGAGGEV